MTLRGPAVCIVLALALAGCGDARSPRAATPSVPSAAPTPAAPERLPQARGCVSEGAPFPVARSRLALARRSIVTGDRRVLDPLVFAPRGGRCARPLIVFSHGHHGEPRSCLRLCTALARAGFIVVALRHEDRAVDGYGLQAGERFDDVEWVLDHLDARYDRDRIGIAGHSFGGITAGEAASQDPRLRAVLSMAGTASHGTMGATRAPTLIMAGTRDPIETVESSRAAAGAIPATVPHELVVIEGAGHGQLLSLCAQIGSCAEVERRATAFFERALAGRG